MTPPSAAPPSGASPKVVVFGSSVVPSGSEDYAQAQRLGMLLAGAGFEVWNGGYLGTMEAVARGVQEAGGRSVGVTIEAWDRFHPGNTWLTETVPTPDIHERLRRLTSVDAAIAVNGGIGTLTEVALFWSKAQLDRLVDLAVSGAQPELEKAARAGRTVEAIAHHLDAAKAKGRRPLILVGARWASLMDALSESLALTPTDRDLVTLVDSVEDCVPALRRLLPAAS